METNLYSLIPKVDEILEYIEIKKQLDSSPRSIVLEAVREESDKLRTGIKEGKNRNWLDDQLKNLDSLISDRVKDKTRFSLRRVVNATGVVIHTNLGRSLINRQIMEQVVRTATSYSNLEYDLKSGSRGSRYDHLELVAAKTVGGEAGRILK